MKIRKKNEAYSTAQMYEMTPRTWQKTFYLAHATVAANSLVVRILAYPATVEHRVAPAEPNRFRF